MTLGDPLHKGAYRQSDSRKKAVVTGGAGFNGSHPVEERAGNNGAVIVGKMKEVILFCASWLPAARGISAAIR